MTLTEEVKLDGLHGYISYMGCMRMAVPERCGHDIKTADRSESFFEFIELSFLITGGVASRNST